MLYEFGIGLGFLATTRRDGGPRVHPICPILTERGLFAFIVPGPKLGDLHRDSRFAFHSETFPPPRHDDAFYVTGSVSWIDDGSLHSALADQLLSERKLEKPWDGFEAEELIEFRVGTCLLTLTQPDNEFPQKHTAWHV